MRGQLVTSFDFPDQRHGSEPDRFLADILDLDLVLDEAEGFVDLQYAKMMALAERITGVHLSSTFLQRRIIASRTDVPYDDDDEGYGL